LFLYAILAAMQINRSWDTSKDQYTGMPLFHF
jgi:hypothetical protein